MGWTRRPARYVPASCIPQGAPARSRWAIRVITMPIRVITMPIRVITMPIRLITMRRSW